MEGLTVSYFTRESKMYDTLMQMGRWFGFRDGYVDLCRLYVTDDLFTWFKHISFATEDLRDQIQYMNEDEETPENFGLRVATHPKLKSQVLRKYNQVKNGVLHLVMFLVRQELLMLMLKNMIEIFMQLKNCFLYVENRKRQKNIGRK